MKYLYNVNPLINIPASQVIEAMTLTVSQLENLMVDNCWPKVKLHTSVFDGMRDDGTFVYNITFQDGLYGNKNAKGKCNIIFKNPVNTDYYVMVASY